MKAIVIAGLSILLCFFLYMAFVSEKTPPAIQGKEAVVTAQPKGPSNSEQRYEIVEEEIIEIEVEE